MSSSYDEFEKQWSAVLTAEHAAINKRRGSRAIARANTVDGKPYGASGNFDTVGLALSGGGIRSAAFCLGTLQSLADHGKIGYIDYLSTVSGGGYTGAAVTAAMSETGGAFPFQGPQGDFRDPAAIGHLRNYSNYLLPRGKRSILEDVTIVLRGLITNVLLVLPVILLFAAITIYLNPTLDSLYEPYFDTGYLKAHLAVTGWIAAVLFAVCTLWAIYRSIFKLGDSEFGGWPVKIVSILLVLLAVSAICEIQPVIIGWMYDSLQTDRASSESRGYSVWVTQIITYLTPAMAVVSLFAKRIGEFLQLGSDSGSYTNLIKRFFGRAILWGAALALPVLLWMVYLLLVYWGIPGVGKGDAPNWLWSLWRYLGFNPYPDYPAFAGVYLFLAFVIAALTVVFLTPNANSLHRLYRDRLSDAFLARTNGNGGLISRDVKLSAIDTDRAPYHLINAALNIQGSPEANARGRNADLFFFGKAYSGSWASGFRPTAEFEKADAALTLGTAMAISGAAVSSNMGSESVSVMAPTLALLNLRLGYWLKNPAGKGSLPAMFYLASEIISRLRPKDGYLYLTDGGHIENLGLYELLRRRCSHIIVIDAEADPRMTFTSFVKLQRHARIDLGVRINLRWDSIAATSLKAREKDAEPKRGPHCAVGEIEYSNGGKGRLVYVKSSLSGDENVYVRDYSRRYAEFPHETTSDQFFSEEQFEVYRALGFHCVNGLYNDDEVEVSASGVEFWGTVNKKFDRALLRTDGELAKSTPQEPKKAKRR